MEDDNVAVEDLEDAEIVAIDEGVLVTPRCKCGRRTPEPQRILQWDNPLKERQAVEDVALLLELECPRGGEDRRISLRVAEKHMMKMLAALLKTEHEDSEESIEDARRVGEAIAQFAMRLLRLVKTHDSLGDEQNFVERKNPAQGNQSNPTPSPVCATEDMLDEIEMLLGEFLEPEGCEEARDHHVGSASAMAGQPQLRLPQAPPATAQQRQRSRLQDGKTAMREFVVTVPKHEKKECGLHVLSSLRFIRESQVLSLL